MLVKPKTSTEYIDSDKPSKVTKQGIRIIDNMPTYRILGHVVYKHRAGLKTLTIVSLISYIAYDKTNWIF